MIDISCHSTELQQCNSAVMLALSYPHAAPEFPQNMLTWISPRRELGGHGDQAKVPYVYFLLLIFYLNIKHFYVKVKKCLYMSTFLCTIPKSWVRVIPVNEKKKVWFYLIKALESAIIEWKTFAILPFTDNCRAAVLHILQLSQFWPSLIQN